MPPRCDAAFAQVVAAFGGVDIAVSNAGAAWQGSIGEVDEAVLRKSFELNFFAHQKVAQAAVKIMLAQGTGGCLLFNVSKQAVNPGPNFGPYGLPKAATLFLVRQYALDYGADGIRANAVNADRIRSGLLTDDFIKQRSRRARRLRAGLHERQPARPRGHRGGRGAGLPGAGAGAEDHRRRHHRGRRQYRGGVAVTSAIVKIRAILIRARTKRSPTMPRLLALTALLPLLLIATPAAAAVTAKEKVDTCKVGADEQKLEGAKRKAFLAKCMGKGNYEPKARIDLKKKTRKVKRKPKPRRPLPRPLLRPLRPGARARCRAASAARAQE